MAKKRARPARRLVAFALVVAALYGAVALGDHDPGRKGYQVGGVWKPKLGLDLQGGTRITLQASTENGKKPSQTSMNEARGIIDQRVNGSGVSESEVAIQGGNNVVVEIPGRNSSNLVDTVKRTAQLRFRLVAAVGAGQPQPAASASPSGTASGSASGSASPSGSASASASGSAAPSAKETAKPTGSASPKGRALSRGLVDADKPASRPAAKASAKANAKASASASPSASSTATSSSGATSSPSAVPSVDPSALASAAATPQTTKKGAAVSDPLKWMDNPGDAWLKKFAAYRCPTGKKAAAPVFDDKDKPLVTCNDRGEKELLSASMIEGTRLSKAVAAAPDQQNLDWRVVLTFKSDARKVFANVTAAIANQTSPLTGQQKQFAIVLDGRVISDPTVNEAIPNGTAEISGNFTQTSAQSLANSLKYGALPLKFKVPVETVEGPTLAGNQLSGGLIAGGIGLALVLVYCLLYYRGLGIVVLASLVIAGVLTYAVVLAMSQAVSFTLTLPGIAGLIVAVGITADSFIVYFERIRDEMREGKSMRVAVEAGWVRARNTCLAADAVSLLAAVVLYIFSIGVVKGFAFTLGISTVIDLVVFFWFTKPMVSWLATFRFFSSGHRLSGLSPDQVGRKARVTTRPVAAGGNA